MPAATIAQARAEIHAICVRLTVMPTTAMSRMAHKNVALKLAIGSRELDHDGSGGSPKESTAVSWPNWQVRVLTHGLQVMCRLQKLSFAQPSGIPIPARFICGRVWSSPWSRCAQLLRGDTESSTDCSDTSTG